MKSAQIQALTRLLQKKNHVNAKELRKWSLACEWNLKNKFRGARIQICSAPFCWCSAPAHHLLYPASFTSAIGFLLFLFSLGSKKKKTGLSQESERSPFIKSRLQVLEFPVFPFHLSFSLSLSASHSLSCTPAGRGCLPSDVESAWAVCQFRGLASWPKSGKG